MTFFECSACLVKLVHWSKKLVTSEDTEMRGHVEQTIGQLPRRFGRSGRPKAGGVMARLRHGTPGLAVRELRGSDLGTKTLQEGRAAVYVKSNEPHEHPIVLHEFLATRLAHSLGLPVPFGEVAALLRGQRGWASAVLGGSAQAAAPANIKLAAQQEPHIFAGICVFDVWIHNIDRTDENTYYSEDYGLWALDHEQTFGAHNPLVRDSDLLASAHSVEPPYRHSRVAPDEERLRPWQQLITQFGASWAKSACDVAVRRGLQDKRVLDVYSEFLRRRAGNLNSLLDKAFDRRVKSLF